MFAKFVERLKEMPDGDGSVLDHSIILFGSNMANSDAHNNDPLPQVLIGRGGGVKGGQHLHYPQDTPHANILVTMLDRAGVPAEDYRELRRQHRRLLGGVIMKSLSILARDRADRRRCWRSARCATPVAAPPRNGAAIEAGSPAVKPQSTRRERGRQPSQRRWQHAAAVGGLRR